MKYLCNVYLLMIALCWLDCNAQDVNSAVLTKGREGKSNANPIEFHVTIYYRWDRHNLDSMYLSNPRQLSTLDSMLTSKNIRHIDTLTIVAFASPEGHPDYNKRLSERRANTIRDYIIARYPLIDPYRIVTIARGENWEGLLDFARKDPKLPSRDKVLEIITSGMSDIEKQGSLTKLDGGKTYKHYILPNYYRYLRNGASVFISYQPEQPVLIDSSPIFLETEQLSLPSTIKPIPMDSTVTITRYPIAFRTNLLYDAVGAINLGIEVPFGKTKNWSWIADMAYSYWRSSRNLYALQTLEYGTELRHYFPVSQERKDKNSTWTQPLKGGYAGIYGNYWQRYDIQLIDGHQGDASWSAGITAGYAIPLSRNFSLDLGIGAGYASISQNRHYHQPEYDENGKYHLMWQETSSWSGFSITKLRVALVWVICTKKTRKGGNR